MRAVLRVGLVVATAVLACAHPAPPPAPSAAPAAAAPVAQVGPTDPERCYSRERVPVVPRGQTAPTAGSSLFGRDTALAPGALGPDGKAPPPPGADLDKEIVRRIIRRHIDEVKACYETQLATNAQLAGEVDVTFLIPASGFVDETHVARSTIANVTVEDCIGRAVCGWQFPRPLEARSVVITYPFKLTAAPSLERSPPSP